MASAEVNNAATVRYTEGLIMQSSITLMFPFITNTIFIVLLNKKKWKSQKKFAKHTNSLLLLG